MTITENTKKLQGESVHIEQWDIYHKWAVLYHSCLGRAENSSTPDARNSNWNTIKQIHTLLSDIWLVYPLMFFFLHLLTYYLCILFWVFSFLCFHLLSFFFFNIWTWVFGRSLYCHYYRQKFKNFPLSLLTIKPSLNPTIA